MTSTDGRALFAAIPEGPIKSLILESDYADTIGGPSTVEIEGRLLSPTTVRYGATLTEILKHFPSFLNVRSICEIGVGYGGLARLICELHRVQSGALETYRLVDLPDALSLARQYLEHFHLAAQIEYRSKSELGLRDSYDFVLSNWAFSEFGQRLQREYLDKVIAPAGAGYLVMNSGLDGSKRGYGGRECLSDAEITGRLPKARILENAAPKGYVIVFGETG